MAFRRQRLLKYHNGFRILTCQDVYLHAFPLSSLFNIKAETQCTLKGLVYSFLVLMSSRVLNALLHSVPHHLSPSPPSQSFPIHSFCTSWSLQCTTYKYKHSVFRFILNSYLTFYCPAHCLSVNFRDTVTSNPLHLLLNVIPFLSQEAQFNWTPLAWKHNTSLPQTHKLSFFTM